MQGKKGGQRQRPRRRSL